VEHCIQMFQCECVRVAQFVHVRTCAQIRGALTCVHNVGSYLRTCTTHTVKDLVTVELETWGIVMVLIVFARLLMMIPNEDIKLGVFLSLGVLLLSVMIVTRNKLREIHTMLTSHILAFVFDPGSANKLPYYQQIHRERVRSRMSKGESKLCNGQREPNAHEALFWCGAAGPKFVLRIIRTCSFLVSSGERHS